MKRWGVSAAILLLAASCAGSSSTGATSTRGAPPTTISARPSGPSSFCRPGQPLANVYHPARLLVIARCLTATGTVRTIRREEDGDVHFDLALDAAFRRLLNRGNILRQHGWLVIEIVPADRPGCRRGSPPARPHGSYDFGLCTGAGVRTPRIGSRVSVTGPYVLDVAHGWMEIHPAWHIALLSGSFLPGR